MSQKLLRSWGNYPDYPQRFQSCYWRNELPALIQHHQKQGTTTLPFGNGRSYGDSCLACSNEVILIKPLNRFLHADWQTGVISAEAGITLGEILRQAVPMGWFLPVTPGTSQATLGGAIANDVHGKNHHRRGTFSQHVRQLQLLRSDKAASLCSPQQHQELFNATLGGLGLTGIIQWAEIQLIPVRSSLIRQRQFRFDNLEGFFDLSEKLDPLHEYSVAWVDCLASGKHMGRGIFMVGEHADRGPRQFHSNGKLAIPFTFPVSAFNPLSLKLLNNLYFHLHGLQPSEQLVPMEPFFYPLDSLQNWNRIYGPRGFQQYQCVIPEEQAKTAIKSLLQTIAQSGRGSFLAVLKRCGTLESPGLLSFPLPGISLALDFPQHEHANQQLFKKLDHIVALNGGRLYPAKDAHWHAADFQQAYPAWKQLEALRDPLLNSRFWQRVTRT